ncbi:MAG TPA: hypothetical protein VN905_03665 [Candidatus Binatia bacterium]|nr:hypothetical protein [Candidatus Binatia bacterium]
MRFTLPQTRLFAPDFVWISGMLVALLVAPAIIDPAVIAHAAYPWTVYFCTGAILAAVSLYAISDRAPAQWFASIPTRYVRLLLAACAFFGALYLLFKGDRYVILPFAVVHWLILVAASRRRSVAVPGISDFAIICALWIAVSGVSWYRPFSEVLFGYGGHMPPDGGLPLAVAVVMLVAAGALLAARNLDARGPKGAQFGIVVDVMSLLALGAASLREDVVILAPNHWSFFVGPAELVRQGHWLLWDVPSQYGFLNTLLLAALPFRSVWMSMYILDAVLTFASSVILYWVLRGILAGFWGRLLALIATLVAVFLVPGTYYSLAPSMAFPSVGAFRFFWAEALLAFLLWQYTVQSSARDRINRLALGNVIWLIGVLWSAESAIYCSVIWLPAYTMYVLKVDRAPLWPRRYSRAFWACVPYALLLAAILTIHVFYQAHLGHGPDYYAFVEFGLTYAGGFGAVQPYPPGAVWSLVLGFAALLTAIIVVKRHRGGRAVPALIGTAAGFWAICSYFVSRSVENNATNLTTVFWLCVAIAATVLQREKIVGPNVRAIRDLLVPVLVIEAAMTLGRVAALPDVFSALSPRYTIHVESLRTPMDAELTQLLGSFNVHPPGPIVYGAETLMAPWPDQTGIPRQPMRWLPAAPTALYTLLSPARRNVYARRFVALQPLEGWYLGPVFQHPCEKLSPMYETANSKIGTTYQIASCRRKPKSLDAGSPVGQ